MIETTSGHADHGPHVLSAERTARRITWLQPQSQEERRRTVQWTCACRATVYYLIAGGGQMHIARVDRSGRHVTHRMSHRDAQVLWNDVLFGRAV
ncbi:hypothetical protein DQ384_33960 [Sphaerisporangium album]|uniref:Uncharacterized protein n=1 Tax=Sphaerisporangium album TaxID=509200 RepID=A0A367EYY7_9ACTN|nr:hypothetical protein [Sphaerisporangium album]RCG23376.1 hypothetical protein DQ384_33960 [Sphaerisporangium album]